MNATFTVPVIRIADFINKVVATRSLPADQPGAVVMKLEVEVPPLSNDLHIQNLSFLYLSACIIAVFLIT